MHLSQARLDTGPAVILRDSAIARIVQNTPSTYELATAAIRAGRSLLQEIALRGLGVPVDLPALAAAGRMMTPLEHPDPGHLHLTGTGLTHLGSAATRDAMHAKAQAADATDSLKMFRMGQEGGKPTLLPGAQPEWFYKGNGHAAVAPGAPLTRPAFALDGGEEPEIAGLYVIGPDGTPHRIGWTLANEFSDHVTERINYLFLAHSKLRPASFGPEILLGDLPDDVQGTSRIWRDGAVIWEKPFLSGTANMTHSFANLEHHHFKYALFRQPGDVHVHMFGTATLSFADGISPQPGDIFDIASPTFGLPLQNPLAIAPDAGVAVVRSL